MAVEKVGQDESRRRFVTCYHCGAKLAYYPCDVREKMTFWSDTDATVRRFIECPQCNKSVSLEQP